MDVVAKMARSGPVRRSIAAQVGAGLLCAIPPSAAVAVPESANDSSARSAWSAAANVIEAVEASRRETRRTTFGGEAAARHWPSSPPTGARFEAQFRPASEDAATLIFDASPGRAIRLAVVKGGSDLVPIVRTLDATPEELVPLVAEIRRLALLRPPASRGRITRLGDELGHKLLAPAADELRGTSRLVLLANGPLVELPFGVVRPPRSLDPDGRYLFETRELCWLTPGGLRPQRAAEDKAPEQPAAAVAIADAVYRPPARPLGASMSDGGISWRRHAARRNQSRTLEVLALPNVAAFGQAATPTALWELAASHRIDALHLAVEAFVDAGDPGASALLLSGRRYDEPARRVAVGALASDLALGPNALVALSGLDTGGAGLGPQLLVDAFDAAGAKTVVSSLWPVVDETATKLFDVFYRGLSDDVHAAAALRAAQTRLLDEPLRFDQGEGREPVIFDASHPFHWAGYAVHQRSVAACGASGEFD